MANDKGEGQALAETVLYSIFARIFGFVDW